MSDDNTIQVNFGRPMPVFPLEQVSLLPQQVRPLHIFEPRYRQMVAETLDGAGQIAMGVFERRPKNQSEYEGRPEIRPAVCIGQIVQHEALPEEDAPLSLPRYNILLQGICRARVLAELPRDDERLYREVMLEPVGAESPDEESLRGVRDKLESSFSEGGLSKFRRAHELVQFLRNEKVPTSALMEVIAFTMISDPAVHYDLLAEGDAIARWKIIRGQLETLERLARLASKQLPGRWPKGVSWN
jgi:hypothetical protein